MKRTSALILKQRSKRQHVENDTNYFLLISVNHLIPYLDCKACNSMLRLTKETNLVFNSNRKLIVQKYDGDRRILFARLRIMHTKNINAAQQICQEIFSRPVDIRDPEFIENFIYNPTEIKRCPIPAKWLMIGRNGYFNGYDGSLELALQGYPDFVVAYHAKHDGSRYCFSDWKPTEKFNMKSVRTLAKYINFERAIEQPVFAEIMYNQTRLQLVDLYKKWQSVSLFVRYRAVPYTEKDLKRFTAKPERILKCKYFKIPPPLWVFKRVFDRSNAKTAKQWISEIFNPSDNAPGNIALHLIYDEVPELVSYFKKKKLWRMVIDTIFKQTFHDKTAKFLRICDFEYTQSYCESLNIDFKGIFSEWRVICHHTPPVWALELGFQMDSNWEQTISERRFRRSWLRHLHLEGMFFGGLPNHVAFFKRFDNFVWDDHYWFEGIE